MTVSRDFDSHLCLLADSLRLQSFEDAIRSLVRSDDIVLDVGSGLGILSLMASKVTSKTVHAYEYYSDIHELATILADPTASNIRYVNSNAIESVRAKNASVVLCELIGNLGPDESIVELIYFLKQSIASIETIVPKTLKLYAQTFRSPSLLDERQKRTSHLTHSCGKYYGKKAINLMVDAAYSLQVRFGRFDEGFSPIDATILLANYVLGSTPSSNFKQDFPVGDADGVYFFFECGLTDSHQITNRFDAAEVHWEQAFALRPRDASKLEVSYSSGQSSYNLSWS